MDIYLERLEEDKWIVVIRDYNSSISLSDFEFRLHPPVKTKQEGIDRLISMMNKTDMILFQYKAEDAIPVWNPDGIERWSLTDY